MIMPGLLKVHQSSDEEDDVRSSSTVSIVSGTSTRRSSVSSIGRQLGGAIHRSGSILGKLKRSRSKTGSEPDLFRFDSPKSPKPHFTTFKDELIPLILDALEPVHRGRGTCYTCLARDLAAYAGVNRKFREVGLKRLYSAIYLHGDECSRQRSHSHKAPHPTSRLQKLKKTLENRPEYGEWILTLKVPEHRRDLPPTRIAHYQAEIAAVVLLCPNLERLLGAQFPMTTMSNDLLHALKSRKNLREHFWLLSSSERPTPRDSPDSFISFHRSWLQLQTLVITGEGSSCVSETFIMGALKSLPSLQRLMVARFPKSAFSDAALRELPALRALRLEQLPGVTDAGLLSYTRNRAQVLESLALIGLRLERLSTISLIMSSAQQMWSFTLEQDAETLRATDSHRFESVSLISLHWDIRKTKVSPLSSSKNAPVQASSVVTAANSALAKAIEGRRFPSLRKLRAPSDGGDLQKVCRPRWSIARPTDFVFEFSTADDGSTNPSTASFLPRHHLREARRRAQERIEQARIKMPMFTINIEEDGDIKTSQVIRDRSSALGDDGSNVVYDLNPDFEDGYPTSSSSAFVGLDEILGQWKLEVEPHNSSICTGGENRGSTLKKGKRAGSGGIHWHQERSSFFMTLKLEHLFGAVAD